MLTSVVIALLGISTLNSPLFAAPCDGVPPVDGRNLPTKYAGFPNAIQDNPTGFGDATPPSTADTEGNELDRLYIRNTATHMFVGLTGNTERDDVLDNTMIIFIDTDAGATPTALNTSGFTGGSLAVKNISGVTLDFDPEYAIAFWNTGTTPNVVLHTLANPTDAGTTSGFTFAINNTNLAGVNGEAANDPLQQQTNAATAINGLEVQIELAALSLTSTSPINVQALLVNGAGFISNQSLPPLNPTSGNQGGGVPCVGAHDPGGDPPVVIDFGTFTGNQFAAVTLNPGASPGPIDGTDIPAAYSSSPPTGTGLISTQNNYTCFGDAAPFSPLPAPGTEIDRIWVRSDFSKMYIGVTGNIPVFPDFNNTLLIFIDTPGDNGSNILFTSPLIGGSGALQGMDGVTFDPGFAPEYCIEYWRGNNQHNAIIEDLNFDSDIPLEFSIDTARHTNLAVNAFSADLSNILGINNIPGDDPIRQQAKALTAISGMQFSIRLASLGLTDSSQVKIAAIVASGSGFISNQSLPPLNPTVPTPATGSQSFSNAPLPLAIPDNNPTGASDPRTVTIAGVDRITDLNVSVNITHPQMNNLTVTLTHVTSEISVNLVTPATGTGSNLNVTFSSDLPEFPQEPGTVAPAESLLSFNGQDPNGQWTLKVVDSVTGDTGTLNSWGLFVTKYTGGNVGCLGEHDAVENPIDFGTNSNTPGDQFLTVTLSPSGTPSSSPTNSLFSGSNIPKVYDGTTPASGGGTLPAAAALAVQNNYTCFGDAVTAPPQNLPGSEMDRIFVTNSSNRLKVAITGNLENNGNAYVLLLDTLAGGSGTITGQTSPPGAILGFNNVIFDSPFTPDYALVVQRNNEPNNQEYSVFLKTIASNSTRSIGRLTRNTGSGVLSDPIPNGNGSELDEMFLQNDADNLYIGLTGNLEANGNGYIIFIETGAGGFTTLDTNYSGNPQILRNVSGDTLDVGFAPNWAIVMTRSGGNYNAQLVDLTDTTPPTTPIALTFQNTIGTGNTFFGDNSNSVGVNSNFTHSPPNPPVCPDDPTQQAVNAHTATRGVQFAINRSTLGILAPGTDNTAIKISAVCVGGSGYWSNQTLPPLGGCQLNLMDNANLQGSTAPGDQFLSYTLAASGGYDAPETFDGTNINDLVDQSNMGPPKATQNNFTQFGDATAPNPGNPNCIQVAFDDTNILGVTGNSVNSQTCQTVGGSVAGAANAQTGMEFDIPMADIGLTPPSLGTQVRVLAVLTGSSGYFSNQTLPGLGVGNAWNLGVIGTNPPCDRWSGDLSSATYPGNQWLGHTIQTPCSNIPGDINGDGVKDAADIAAFVGVLLGTNTTPCDVSKSEFVIDGLRNGRDIAGFIPAFLAP